MPLAQIELRSSLDGFVEMGSKKTVGDYLVQEEVIP